jgi:3D (Asp-Asp-Asp) domain-containing protein
VGLPFAIPLGVVLAVSLCAGCVAVAGEERQLSVRASAYNSVVDQTDTDPSVTAWGDRLEPGMRAIAVSRDLIALGLRHGTLVRIDGFPGEFRVLDKMGSRWKRKIDIYMGVDVEAALRWGIRPVTITWKP